MLFRSDSGIDIEQPVNLDVGDNYFFIEVEAELGNTRRYLIHIFRAGAELDLEWVRVNGQRAAKEGMIYVADVKVGSKPVITAQARQKEAFTYIQSEFKPAEFSDQNILAGKFATLGDGKSTVTLDYHVDDQGKVVGDDTMFQIKVRSVIVTETVLSGEPLDKNTRVTRTPSNMLDNIDEPVVPGAPGLDFNRGTVTVETVEYKEQGDGQWVMVTTVEQYKMYTLVIRQLDEDGINFMEIGRAHV